MRRTIFIITFYLFMFSRSSADIINGEVVRTNIDIKQAIPPKPKASDCCIPTVAYIASTSSLLIELDTLYYSNYIIILEGAYTNLDYYVTTATQNIPLNNLDSVINIYIESDDYGTYFGIIDRTYCDDFIL